MAIFDRAGKLLGSFKRKQAAWLVGGSGAVGGVMLVLMLLFGAQFELVHIAKIFFGNNFGIQERFESERGYRVMQRVFGKGGDGGRKPIRTGNPVGDRIAELKLDRFETKLKNQGYELAFEDRRLVGVRNTRTGEIDDLSTATPRERRQALRQTIDEVIPHWKVGKRLRYRSLMFARAGVTWKFFEKSQEKARDYVKKKKKSMVRGEDNGYRVATGDKQEGETDEEFEQRKNQTDEIGGELGDSAQEARDAYDNGATADEAAKGAAGKRRAAFGVTALIIGACVVQNYAAQAEDIAYATRAEPLMRLGNMVLTAGDQIKTGDDVPGDQVNEFMRTFHDDDEHFTQSAAYKRVADEPVTAKNPDLPDDAKPGEGVGNIANSIGSSLNQPGLNQFCAVVNNVVVGTVLQIVEIGAAVLSGGTTLIATAGAEAAFFAFDKFFPSIIKFFAGLSVTGDEKPIEFANKLDAGLNISANEYARNLGGRALADPEVASLQAALRQDQAIENSKRGLAWKLFSPDSTESLTNRAIVYRPHTAGEALGKLAAVPQYVFKNIAMIFTGLRPAIAAEDGKNPYGIEQYGFTDAEIQMYEPDENGEWVQNNMTEEERQKYQECFDLSYTEVKDRPECREDTEKYRRYRIYALDRHIICNLTTMTSQAANECLLEGTASGSTEPAGSDTVVPVTGESRQLRDRLLANPLFAGSSANAKNDVRNGIAHDNLVKLLIAIVEQAKVKINVSTIKTGHKDCSSGGSTSNHYSGLAADIGNEEAAGTLMPWIFQNRETLQIDELIFVSPPPGSSNLDQGQPHQYNASTLRGHSGHIHVSVFGPKRSAGCPRD